MNAWQSLSPDGKVEAVKAAWTDGVSAGDLASCLTATLRCRVTRNAVIGVYDRNKRVLTAYPLLTQPEGIRHWWAQRTREPKPKRHNPGSWRTGSNAGPRTSMFGRALKDEHRKPPCIACEAIDTDTVIEPTAPEPLMLSLLDLERRHCRWPIGDPKQEGFGFCDHPHADGGPYCPYHTRLSIGPGTSSERDAGRELERVA